MPAGTDDGPTDPLDVELAVLGDAFIAQADAITHLLAITDEDVTTSAFDLIDLAGLSRAQREQLHSELGRFSEALGSSVNHVTTGDAVDEAQQQPVSLNVTDPEINHVLGQLVLQLVHRVKMPPRSRLLNRAALLISVSDFEFLMGRVVRLLLLDRPALLGEQMTVTLAEIEGLSSISEVRDILADRRVDEFLRQGLQDWEK